MTATVDNDPTLRWEQDPAGGAGLTLDDPRRSANTMNERFVGDLAATLDRLEAGRDGITGVILTSAKKTFFAGGDLDEMLTVTRDQAAALTAHLTHIKAQLRRLETLGR